MKKTKTSLLFIVILSLFVGLFPNLHQVCAYSSQVDSVGTFSDATAMFNQQQLFKMAGLWWAFYPTALGGNYVFKTSSDGLSWSSATTFVTGIGTNVDSRQLSLDYNGSHVAYARSNGEEYGKVFYRLGLPHSNGTITWSADEQTVINDNYAEVGIQVRFDVNDYVWIAFRNGTSTTWDKPCVYKNSLKNGSWSTGFVAQITSVTGLNYGSIEILPLSNGNTYFVWTRGSLVEGRLYNGSWQSVESIEGNTVTTASCCAVEDGNNIHIAYLKKVDTAYYSTYRRRTWGVGWGYNSTIDTLSDGYMTSLTLAAENSLYAIYGAGSELRYNYYDGSAWSGRVVWESGISPVITYSYGVISMRKAADGKIAALFNTGFGAVTHVILFSVAEVALNIGTFQAPSGRKNINEYFFLNATVQHPNGVQYLKNATLTLNYTINLNWFNNTNTFTKTGDGSSYCTLDAANSIRTTVNSITYKLSWKVKFSIPLKWSIVSAIVFDSSGYNGTNSATNLFTTDYVKIDTFSVSDNHINVGDTASFTVAGKYALDNSAWSGTYTLNDTKTKSIVDKYWYKVSSITDSNYGLTTFTQTASNLYVIFDRAIITIIANTTNPAPNKVVSFTLTAIYDYDDSPITSWTVNTLRNSIHFKSGNFTDYNEPGTLCYYTAENITTSEGITVFTCNTVTVYWSDYVALTVKAVDLDGEVIVGATVNFNIGVEYNKTTDSNGLATLTGIVENTNVAVKILWGNMKVNGTWTLNMTTTKTVEASCNVWSLTFNAKDSSGTALTLTPTQVYFTYPNGTTTMSLNTTTGLGSFKVANGTSHYKIKFQGQWVSANVTLPMTSKNVTSVNVNCWIYKLTVYVTNQNGVEMSGATLTLTRGDAENLTNYGLTPKTADYYNSTHARYVWTQLANQTASYTVFATSGGKTASQETSLTANKAITLTIPSEVSGGPGAPSGPSGTTPPPQQPPYIPPVELPKVSGPEFNYGIMVLLGVVISAVVVAAVFAKPKRSLQAQWKRKTRVSKNSDRAWRKKRRR